ncbi:transporter substrate-binding domain-containing protein [Thalassobaculum sp.]|uniref:substrate-binding periplasmic protein n=1 Tax=Thalassobaculum sp. TaxID=2022740 RepID=UPI0032ED1552
METNRHHCERRPAALALVLAVCLMVWTPTAVRAGPPAVFDGRPTLVIVYETTPNPPRHLGEGTAIDWGRPGLTIELLKLVGERLRVNLDFKRVPWKRGLLLLETGEADAIFHSSYVAEREAIGAYPKTASGEPDARRAIFTQSYVLFVTKDSGVTWDGATLGGLGGRPVGATAGYSVVRDLERSGVAVQPGRVPALNLAKLLEGRIAAYAELEGLADQIIRQDAELFRQVVKLQPPLITKPYYLMLSRPFVARDPALAEAVWDALAEVRASEEFRKLEDLYAGGS